MAVATTNMSTAAMSVTWFCRKLRPVGEVLGSRRHVSPHGSFTHLDAELEQFTMNPKGAPQSGFAVLIWRIKSRTSRAI